MEHFKNSATHSEECLQTCSLFCVRKYYFLDIINYASVYFFRFISRLIYYSYFILIYCYSYFILIFFILHDKIILETYNRLAKQRSSAVTNYNLAFLKIL